MSKPLRASGSLARTKDAGRASIGLTAPELSRSLLAHSTRSASTTSAFSGLVPFRLCTYSSISWRAASRIGAAWVSIR